jgi:hypothetical protein
VSVETTVWIIGIDMMKKYLSYGKFGATNK